MKAKNKAMRFLVFPHNVPFKSLNEVEQLFIWRLNNPVVY